MWQAVRIAPSLARCQPCTMLRYSLVVNILLDYEQSSFQSSITNSLIFILHNLILVNLASSSSSPSRTTFSFLISITVLHLLIFLTFLTIMTIPTNVTNNTVSDNTVNNKTVTTNTVITSAPQTFTSSISTINWVLREYLNNHTSSNIFLYIDDIIVHDEEPSQQ